MQHSLLAKVVVGFTLVMAGPLSAKNQRSINATTLTGDHFDSGRHGRVIIVNFWATWCAPCRAEMPALDAYYRNHAAQDLSVLAISMDDDAKVRAVRAITEPFRFGVAMVSATRLPDAYRPTRLPATLVFDRSGVLRFDSRRAATSAINAATLEQVVTPLLQMELHPGR